MKLNRLELTDLVIPDWPAPSTVGAIVSTRLGGVSGAPYDDFNLATHVGDDSSSVRRNRLKLLESLGLPGEPAWLEQVHGTCVVNATDASTNKKPLIADASYSSEVGGVCVVMTADCLPILLCHKVGGQVAAVHAGWRGLASGIIEETLKAFEGPSHNIIAWLGPAISQPYFEVGDEVKKQFEQNNLNSELAFKPSARDHHWHADLYALAKSQLLVLGVSAIYGGNYCSYSNRISSETKTERYRFFSHRRDGVTGRMATLIWLKENG